MAIPTEVLTWGARVFRLEPGQESVISAPIRYREGMAYPLEVALAGLPQAPELRDFVNQAGGEPSELGG